MAKSEKLFEVLNLIGECPDLSPKDLARLCNVSERAIYRYLNTLTKVGVSIQFQNGGYKLQGYYGDILRKVDTEGLEALKLLLTAGMRAYEDESILEYGQDLIKIIDMNLPKRDEPQFAEIEIVPEEIRATKRGGTITIGQGSKPDIINPVLTSETISMTLMNLIFSGLVSFDAAQRPVPDLAKGWEVSQDGLVWSFFIREDVKFHDGRPLTAHDVEFTYRAIMDPGNASPVAELYELIDRVEVEGDYIFRIILKHPFAPLICRLGRAIGPRHLLENADLRNTLFNRRPVGSGPFKLVDWTEDDTIILGANREYFRKDRPILDRLIFKTYPDNQAALRAIARTEMDIALNLAASDLLFVSRRGTFRIYSASGAFYYAVVFNLKNPIFRDIRLRKALDHAINRNAIIENQLKGHGKICTGPFAVNSWAYNPNVRPVSYSIDKARHLLGQAGWKDNDGDGVLERDGKPLEFSLTVQNISDVLGRIAIAIKAQLMKIGIKVKLTHIDDSEPYKNPFQAILTMINAGADPDYARVSWHSESGDMNLASYRNKFVDNLFERGRQTSDADDRKTIYHSIHEMIHDDCPAIFLASAFEYIGSRYKFRNDGFSSTLQFLTTTKDWQIVDREREYGARDTQIEKVGENLVKSNSRGES